MRSEQISRATEPCILFHPAIPEADVLVEKAVQRGWQGNLRHCFLAEALISDENVFSLACERRVPARDSLWKLALRDMEVIRCLFALPEEDPILAAFEHGSEMARTPAATAVSALARDLAAAETAEELLDRLTAFYTDHGAGVFGTGALFRTAKDEHGIRLLPVEGQNTVRLGDLVGYEKQKAQLSENTTAFLHGRKANNTLLYGDAGTGKSTSIRALATEFASQGLRVIEVHKREFEMIPDLFAVLKNRNYRFILFLDDLSFEENEVSYKQLKAAIEGGAESAPENVLIYATSNRRHLIRETWSDRSDMEHNGDIHRSDTMEEKLSLSGRFGLQIFYPNPSFEEYHTIVRTLAGQTPGLSVYSPEELRTLASTWQVRHGSRSGRSAQQFVNDLLCRGQ